MPQDILTINQGSSSLKFSVYEAVDSDRNAAGFGGILLRIRGSIERVHDRPEFRAKDEGHQLIAGQRWSSQDAGHEPALDRLLGWLRDYRGNEHLKAVGHRVVHGGTAFTAPVLVDDSVLAALEQYIPLAPLHQPHNLAAIRALQNLVPGVPQVACFDTAFHTTLPDAATQFALPVSYRAEGVRRFGFHGLSYEYIVSELQHSAPSLARGRVIAAHLGAGATLCALLAGRSIASTTGLTELDGLPMETRCGSIDPGVLLYLMRVHHLGLQELEHLLYHESGLLGLSGRSGSMQDLLESADGQALEAISYFVYQIVRQIGALTACLGGLDGLVFTGGIGEHAPAIRSWICRHLQWLGVRLDEAANARDAELVSLPESTVSVRVIPTNEELMVAHHTLRTLDQSHQQLERLIA